MYKMLYHERKIIRVLALTIYFVGCVTLGIVAANYIDAKLPQPKFISLTDLKLPIFNQTDMVADVKIYDGEFYPATVSITEGQQVIWTNEDTVPHTVTQDPSTEADDGEDFNSDAIAPGDSYTYTFTKKGTYTYHDENNPLDIQGSIIVK